MKKIGVLAVIVCMMAVVNFASADIIRGINIDFVTIGNPGNATDPATGSLYGAVSYNYRIGKYEVTAHQYQTASAVGGFNTGFGSGDMPVYYVSWFDAARFCNYLTTGNKDIGVYNISGSSVEIMDHQLAGSTYGVAYFLPSEDEWYKAAYYKPDGSGYSIFANGTNVAPIAGIETNYNAGYGQYWAVGSGAMEQNGTFDMMGNRDEWTEGLDIEGRRIIRGGNCRSSASYLMSSMRLSTTPYNQSQIGFRIASIPEPATLSLLGLGGLILRRKRS
ncbi:MAG: SUMF1/EgtB/PvdO family nonheme iron enzyme [Sedimentisphaerales bacterium]